MAFQFVRMKKTTNLTILYWFASEAEKLSEIKIGLIAANETDNKLFPGKINRSPSIFLFFKFKFALRNLRKVLVIIGPCHGPLQMREITVLY
jgi:hypothetical protein